MNTNGMIFVFGSNLSGIHGAGAAAYAHKHKGAVWGNAEGPSGQSYAIPTKDKMIRHTLALGDIKYYVDRFLAYAAHNPQLNFQVTRIGCGLAGLKDHDVAPMFIDADKYNLPNVWFDNVWMHEFAATGKMSPAGYNIWGTF